MRRADQLGRSAESAGELAWRMLCVADCGISYRENGWCLGQPRAADVVVAAHGGLVWSTRRSDERLRLLRARHAHDAGCDAMGARTDTVVALLRAWDSCGAAPLLEEAYLVAVAEMHASPVGWQPDRARGAIAFAVRSRITPKARGS